MKKIKKDAAEYRYYEVPAGMPLLALQGIQWERIYGRDVDCLHFHNLLEIGYCFDGTGELTILERDYRFSGDMLTLVPRRMPHTTTSDPGVTAKWEWLFVNLESFLGQCFPGNALMRQRISRRINSGAWVLRGGEAPELAVRIRQLLEVMRRKEEFYQEEARGLLLAFLIDIARRSSERVWEEALLEHCGCEGAAAIAAA